MQEGIAFEANKCHIDFVCTYVYAYIYMHCSKTRREGIAKGRTVSRYRPGEGMGGLVFTVLARDLDLQRLRGREEIALKRVADSRDR